MVVCDRTIKIGNEKGGMLEEVAQLLKEAEDNTLAVSDQVMSLIQEFGSDSL